MVLRMRRKYTAYSFEFSYAIDLIAAFNLTLLNNFEHW